MHRNFISSVLVAGALLAAIAMSMAQAPARKPPTLAPQKPSNKYDVIQMAEWDFVYGNEKDWNEGLTYLQQMCDEKLDPYQAEWRDEKWRDYVSGRLYIALQEAFKAKRYQLCDQAATYGTILGATQLPWVEKFLAMKVQANLKLGKNQEALSLAKSYYNVCSMAKTSEAIDLVCLCLVNDPANAATAVRRFRLQQLVGATPPGGSGGSASTTRPTSLLEDVSIDGGPYLTTIEQLESREESYIRLIDRANLLLMADQPSAARALFSKAYALAAEKRLAEASEGIARAMRAEDHTVGRANAWILSLRQAQEGK